MKATRLSYTDTTFLDNWNLFFFIKTINWTPSHGSHDPSDPGGHVASFGVPGAAPKRLGPGTPAPRCGHGFYHITHP